MKLKNITENFNIGYEQNYHGTNSKDIDMKVKELLRLYAEQDLDRLGYLETDQNYITQVVKLVRKYISSNHPSKYMEQFLDIFTPETIASLGTFEI